MIMSNMLDYPTKGGHRPSSFPVLSFPFLSFRFLALTHSPPLPSCKPSEDCSSPCANQVADNTQALTVGFLSTFVQQSFCTCSVAAAEIVDEILIGLGEMVCVVWNEAFQDAALVLAFVVPYVGEAAEGVEVAKLFKAAKKVFKKGAKNCDLACPGHQYTVVDQMDVDSMRDVRDCDE
jgi:hypothetical protein